MSTAADTKATGSQEANVKIAISEDGLTATIAEYTKPGPGKPSVSATLLTVRMKSEGITVLNGPELDDVIIKASKGKDITGMVVARGIPPKEAQDAHMEPIGDHTRPVFKGDAFAKLVHAQKPTPGTSVQGTPVLPKSDKKPKEIEVPESKGCEVYEDTGEVVATHYGLAEVRSSGIAVKPLLRVSPDQITVTTTVFPHSFDNELPTLEKFKRELWALGIRSSADKSLTKAINKAIKSDMPQGDIVAAKGRAPIDGKDGRFEVLFTGDEDKPSEDSIEVYDPRERSIFKPIREGTIIGKLHPPTEGRFGQDVFGEDLVPRKGQPKEVKAGENVEIAEDGISFRAAMSGMISWTGNTVAIQDVIKINGDVSYATGNVKAEKGTVDISGSVIDGFKVSAPGDIVVGGAVESAEIAAGGSVGVKAGIVMGGVGHVHAKGDVMCSFAENAIIKTDHNVSVMHNLSNSTVNAGGHVRCRKGKGIILGGDITAGKGVEANEIGTEFGVQTSITLAPDVTLDSDATVEIIGERKKLRAKQSQIRGIIGTEHPKKILEKTPPAKRPEMLRIIKAMIGINNRLGEIEIEMEQRRRALEEMHRYKVKVHRNAHPGTTVNIAGKSLCIHEETGPCVIYFDPGKMTVIMA